MRAFLLLLLLASSAAFGYDVTATMPATTGASSCQLYLNGNAAGTARPCGAAQSYPGLISSLGTYTFTYRAINSVGQSAPSPATTVVIGETPTDPTSPPGISIACDPSPCPANIVITITP